MSSPVTAFHVYVDPATGVQIGRVKNETDPAKHVFNGITNPVILEIPVAYFLTLTHETIDDAIIAIGAAQGVVVKSQLPAWRPPTAEEIARAAKVGVTLSTTPPVVSAK